MNIMWSQFTRSDGRSCRQIEVSSTSDWNLFDLCAKLLAKGLEGQWREQLDGLDQRYWDLEVHSGKITLHLEHYLGITIFPTNDADASLESIALLQEAYDLLVNYNPLDQKMLIDRSSKSPTEAI